MGVSKTKKALKLRRRLALLDQRAAWAQGEQRDRLNVASLATAARIAMLERSRT